MIDARASSHLAAVVNNAGLLGCTALGADVHESLEHGEGILSNLTKHAVFAVKPFGLVEAQEELGAVGVGASVSHGEDTGTSVLVNEVFIGEFGTVDRFATCTVASCEVTTLGHEVIDNSVEEIAFVG